jgi:uncharacterized membrane protein
LPAVEKQASSKWKVMPPDINLIGESNMEMKKPGLIGAVAAIAAGGYLLSHRVRTSDTPGPMLSIEETLVVRPPLMGGLAAIAALAAGAYLLSSWRQKGAEGGSSTVEQTIVVNVPVSTAYNQFTQFEEFPRFMETVEEVQQVDDTHLHWRAVVAGKTKEWDSEITEQIPDQRIAWHSTSGVKNAGVVTFEKAGENKTRVCLQMSYEPESADESIGAALGAVKMTARSNLKKFKQLVEAHGVETGAWRGEVVQH